MTLDPQWKHIPKHARPPAEVQPDVPERHCPSCKAKLFMRAAENISAYLQRSYCSVKCARAQSHVRTMAGRRYT